MIDGEACLGAGGNDQPPPNAASQPGSASWDVDPTTGAASDPELFHGAASASNGMYDESTCDQDAATSALIRTLVAMPEPKLKAAANPKAKPKAPKAPKAPKVECLVPPVHCNIPWIEVCHECVCAWSRPDRIVRAALRSRSPHDRLRVVGVAPRV